jgi:hypothetical protein
MMNSSQFLMTAWLIGIAAYAVYRLTKGNYILTKQAQAFKELTNWQLANPGLYIGNVPYAEALVHKCIKASEKYLRMYHYLPDPGHIDYLQSLLDDHGPEPPGESAPVAKQPKASRAVLFLVYQNVH